MDKKELWDSICKKNPAFLRDNPTFAKGELERFFNTLYDYLLKEGIKIGEEREREKFKKNMSSDLPEGFDILFGGPGGFSKN